MSKTISGFKSSLGLMDATMLVAGSMIGSGIFITLTAALSYGELSAMFPKAGGQYIYLREAYNPLVSFVFGWTFFTVIQTATIAAVGVAFAKFAAYLLPQLDEDVILWDLGFLQVSAAQLVSVVVILMLTVVNTRGVNSGKAVQTSVTIIKIISLLGLVLFGLMAFDGDVWRSNWLSGDAWNLQRLDADGSLSDYTLFAALGAIAAGMVGAIFSSDSWHASSSVAGEIKNPHRNVGLSLALGTIIVTVAYLLTNLKSRPDIPRPYKAFGYPVLPMVYIVMGIAFIVLMAVYKPTYTWSGIIIALLGIPVYYLIRKKSIPAT